MQTKLKITEIFYSIQGESTYAGLPCIFIRLSGCNLRCNYCDTEYTWEEGEFMSIEDILKEIDAYPCNLVEVTGGEPLVQKESVQLLDALIENGKSVLLETNGSMSIHSVPADVVSIVDVKCPDSGSDNTFHRNNTKEIQSRVRENPGSCQLKFVLSSKNDYRWAGNFVIEKNFSRELPILFSPVHSRIVPADLARWIMEDGLNVRLQLQLQTTLWPDISRGV